MCHRTTKKTIIIISRRSHVHYERGRTAETEKLSRGNSEYRLESTIHTGAISV